MGLEQHRTVARGSTVSKFPKMILSIEVPRAS